MSELSDLVAQRGRVKAALTRHISFVDSVDPQDPQFITIFKLRLNKLDKLWVDFDLVQSQIETISPSENEEKERDNFEKTYFDLSARMNDYISPQPTSSKESLNGSPKSGSCSSVGVSAPYPQPMQLLEVKQNISPSMKLPPINLPSFSGIFHEWLPFYDMFKALIHNNNELSDIQKLHYLKCCLKGDAANILNSVELVSSNYVIALNLLLERYHNTNTIVQRHIKELFNLREVQGKSHLSLQQLLDDTIKHVRALKALNQPTEFWDSMLVYLTTSKLDINTFRLWEEKWSGRLATFEDLIDFLEHRCRVLRVVDEGYSSPAHKVEKKTHKSNIRTSNAFVSTKTPTCAICNSPHGTYECPRLLNSSIDDRIDLIKNAKVCFNCLRPHHTASKCRSSGCKRPNCGRRHNSLLHKDSMLSNPSPQEDCQNAADSSSVALINVETHKPESPPQVLLSTAVIHISDASGNEVRCRALLDCGSQSSFVTKNLADRLKIQQHKIAQPIKGIGSSSLSVQKYIETHISSVDGLFRAKIRCLVLPKITEQLPSSSVDISRIKIPPHLKLADPAYFKPDKIDILIGGELFWDLLEKGRIKIARGNLHLQNTRLGWIVSGAITTQSTHATVCNLTTLEELNNNVQRFWAMEEVQNPRKFTGNDSKCEEFFNATTHRRDDGRYIINLPLKQDPCLLGDSMTMAAKRFYSIERKLDNNPLLKQQYSNFIKEYLQLNHMEPILASPTSVKLNYLPHHAVVKESSSTTKVRVVFDASCKTSSGLSLNDIMMVGPVVQQDLFSILTRFRTHRYAITADIEKMYRQIEVNPSQTNLQCILWRESRDKPLQSYRLRTVTYGTASAPYLAIRTLLQLAEDEGDNFPVAAAVVKNDFYVDDCLSGVSDIDSGMKLITQLGAIMNRGGFHLRKWCSNEPRLLQHFPQSELSMKDHTFNQDSCVKMLGLMWNPRLDIFQWEVNPPSRCSTKRMMLSATAQIFDPLGLIGPVILLAKILLQRLWLHSIGWDEPVPGPLQLEWDQFSSSLVNLKHVKVPRIMMIQAKEACFELHGFSDASETAYGACVYIRSVNGLAVNIQLVASKSRVAPLKRSTLPRLELCGAVLLINLMKAVESALNGLIRAKVFYTDSTIVLGWIASPSTHWQTFVANRVAKIQEGSSPLDWHHVISQENPADLISRGSSVTNLIESELWWHGPHWLKHIPIPQGEVQLLPTNLPEGRSSVTLLVCHSVVRDRHLIDQYSNLTKLVNVVAYCFRYLHNLQRKGVARQLLPFLTVRERADALHHLIQVVQQDAFPQEISSLTSNNRLPKASRLASLNCYLHEGIIRVGGRLNLTQKLTPAQKNPIVLPTNSQLTRLIILDTHKRNQHAGPLLLLSIIRQRYWPINGLVQVKKVLKTCITCFRLSRHMNQQIMGNLPKQRIEPARPFLTTGVDYCGPFLTRQNRARGVLLTKSYICLFVCFCTKAVHLELVEDLTSEGFVAALRRFVARRGKPQTIFSDNATNFSRANSEFKELHQLISSSSHQTSVLSTMSHEGIDWKFIPPQSPHFGGLWEAAIKSTKYHLRRSVGCARLTYSELNTLLTQIEASLNSRPLTPLSQNPNDLQPLTPAHFLIGDSLLAAPDTDLTLERMNRLSRWQYIQQLYQQFWSRWSQEYVSSLQQRVKWRTTGKNIKLNTLVLLRDDNTPPLTWRLGRVMELHPGSDGYVRVVTLKTASGILKRAITKICPLPIDSDDESCNEK